jgi:peptidyl-prolyl cis-trans isomerase SurA
MRRTFAQAVGILICAWTLTVSAQSEVIEQILVRVNGEIFTKTQLETRQIQALRQLDRQPDASMGDAELRKILDEVTPELIVTAVDEMLMIQHGRTLGYKMSDEQFNTFLENIKKENKIESEELFQAALKQENMTLTDLRAQLERQMIVSYVQQQEILGRVAVSDTEARRYYDSHLTDFTSAQEITLREIFVATPGDGKTVNVAADEASRERALKIRERALAGEPFEKLAAELSDSPSKANAGLIGPLSLNDLSEDLRKRIESMKAGDVSDLLQTPRGYQILKLESATTAETQTFEQAREEVGNRVFAQKRQEEVFKFLDRLRTEAIIEWKNQELKASYDRGLEQLRKLNTGGQGQ